MGLEHIKVDVTCLSNDYYLKTLEFISNSTGRIYGEVCIIFATIVEYTEVLVVTLLSIYYIFVIEWQIKSLAILSFLYLIFDGHLPSYLYLVLWTLL